MDFFGAQDRARTQTGKLIGLFVLCLFSLTVALYILYAILLGGGPVFDPIAYLIIVAITLGIVGFGTVTRWSSLRQGGSSIAHLLGGKLVDQNTTDLNERKLLNIVEEMSIASGTPMPLVYLMPEDGINAFAAGYSPSDAVIGVTRGCIEQLNRDELQGVIAHEFSHILNGDMRMNIKLVSVLNGIFFIYIIGYGILRSQGRARGKGAAQGALLGLAVMAIGAIGLFFGKLIQRAISRQREYLADAAAVQFTRNPSGIANALKRIGGYSTASRVESKEAVEMGHFFFSSPGLKKLSSGELLATHPPLVNRIKAIEPNFDGSFKDFRGKPKVPPKNSPGKAFAIDPALVAGLSERQSSWIARAGSVNEKHLQKARATLHQFPGDLDTIRRSPDGAIAICLGLIVAESVQFKSPRMEKIRRKREDWAKLTDKALPYLINLQPGQRMPLIDLCMPLLRSLQLEDYKDFRELFIDTIELDGAYSLFEVIMESVVLHHNDRFFFKRRSQSIKYYNMRDLSGSVATILAALAHAGPTDSERAFREGFSLLPALQTPLLPKEKEALDPDKFRRALEQLNLASFTLRHQILSAAYRAVNCDLSIAPIEAELIRGIADAIDCPLPMENLSLK